jgi:CubicO group peptidase (beta-lactamase class C family)
MIGPALSAAVERHIQAGEISGAVTLFAQHGEIVALEARGVSDVDPAHRLQQESIFAIFSMTKPVTALCLCQLIEEGRLRPQDPVSAFVPEFSQPRLVRTPRTPAAPGGAPHSSSEPVEYDYQPLARALTVHDFLNFTSGLQTIGVPNPALPEILSTDNTASWVAKLGTAPLEFQPGSRWHYSNATGYEVVARLIEVVSGMPFDQYARRLLLDPLGMSNTCFGQPASELVVPLGMFSNAPIVRSDFPSGSAGLFSTAADYFKFAQMLLEGGRHGGRQVIAPGAIERMRTPQIGNLGFPGVRAVEYASPTPRARPGLTYGYGLAIVTDAAAAGEAVPSGSFGWDGIGTRRFWVIPSREAIIIMLITGVGPVADATQREIEGIVAKA